MTFRPRIRTIFLVVNLTILMLPVAGVAALRIYDNELIRQTESALLAQGVVLQSTYKNVLLQRLDKAQIKFEGYGLNREVAPTHSGDEELGRLSPRLDVTVDQILPPAETAVEPVDKADQYAAAAGASLRPVIAEAEEVTGATITILDWRGTSVSSRESELNKSFGIRDEVRRALRGEVVSVLRERVSDEPVSWMEAISRRARVLVFVAVPVIWDERVYGVVLLHKPPVSLGRALVQNRDVFAGLLAALILGVSMITLLTTFTIQRPIRQLIRQATRIATTAGAGVGATRPISNPGTVEFEELSEAIASMAKTLEQRNEYIRSFARDVSHEFKTPLASIKGTIELLEDHFETMPSEKRQQFLRMISDDTERLDRLVRRLLELARADVFNPTTEWIDGAELLPDLATRSKIELTMDLAGIDSLPVAMSPDVVESIFTNLFDNAAQHGGTNVRVEVIDRTGSYFKILVSDDGPGISQANRDKIFQSFFTTARDAGGTGLGLPIVKSLLQRHGGDIVLTPAEDRGASFLLTMPRAG